GHPRLALLGLEALGVRHAVLEPQGVDGPQVREPLLEAVLVQQLRDALAGGHVEVVVAAGLRADVEPGRDLLAEERGLALVAAHPQPFGYAALRPAPRRHGSLGPARSHAPSPPAARGVSTPSPYHIRPPPARQALLRTPWALGRLPRGTIAGPRWSLRPDLGS